MSALYAAACEECTFTLESASENTVRTIAGRHALRNGHTVVYGSYDESERPFDPIRDAREEGS